MFSVAARPAVLSPPRRHPPRSPPKKTADPDLTTLPKGDGPLYASADQIYAAMDRWAAASRSAGGSGLFTVYRAADPTKPTNSFPVGRFTDPKVPSANKKRVLITCAVHARELIVPEVCLHLLRLLAGTPADRAPVLAWAETPAALQKAGLLSARRSAAAGAAPADPFASLAPDFAKKYDLHVAPLINLSGRRIIEKVGRYSQRKTGDDPQTDINRNFASGWSGANKDLGSETYPGTAPASQWEVSESVVVGFLGGRDDAAGGRGPKPKKK